MDSYLLRVVHDEVERRHQRLVEAAQTAARPSAIEPDALPAIELPSMPRGAAAPSPRTGPITAPVVRNVLSASGQRQNATSQITLSREEREVAHSSFTDPHLSLAERERLYAANKAKLMRKRADGSYPESGQG